MGCMVVKTKNRRDIWIFIVLVPILLWLSLNFSGDKNNKNLPYSVLNKGSNGVSIMYEAMKELDYPVKLVLENIKDKSLDAVQIVITPGNKTNFDINDDEIRDWIGEGGTLIFLCDEWEWVEADFGEKVDAFYSLNDKKASEYHYENGNFILGDSDLLSNRALTKDTEGAYWILEKIGEWDVEAVEFNEFYQYLDPQQRSLWSDIPKGIKFIIYQIVFLIAAIIFYKGRRFGKPIPLYEEVERTENEYVYSVASLYRQAKSWELVLDNFYKDFLLECEKMFGKNEDIKDNWIVLWEKERLPKLNKAKELYGFVNDGASNIKNRKAKGYLEQISYIEQLKKILIKRREDRWKILKKDSQRI